jgi:hypothetical protein
MVDTLGREAITRLDGEATTAMRLLRAKEAEVQYHQTRRVHEEAVGKTHSRMEPVDAQARAVQAADKRAVAARLLAAAVRLLAAAERGQALREAHPPAPAVVRAQALDRDPAPQC